MKVLKKAHGLLCCLPRHDEDAYLQPLTHFQPQPNNSIEDILEASSRAREDCWKQVGTLEPLVLSHLVNPAFMGGPRWPAMRQAFRVVRRPNGNVIIASDGLSDPFDDISLGEGNVNGFGLEFFIETPAVEVSETIHNIKQSWQFQLLYTVSQLAAGHGGIRGIMDDMTLLSTEAEGVSDSIPEEYKASHVNAAGRVGALLGLTELSTDVSEPDSVVPERVEGMPLTDVLLVNIKLLTLPELKLITEQGAEGRNHLAEIFKGKSQLVSSMTRASQLEEA